MTTTIWYRQNHANNNSSDKSPLHVWNLCDTKYYEENQNVLFMSKNVRDKIFVRRQGSGFSNYASFYFDYSRTRIMDSYILCLFILKKLGRTNIHGLKP